MPLERLTLREDKAILPNLSEDDLEAMPGYDYREYSALPRRRTIEDSMRLQQ